MTQQTSIKVRIGHILLPGSSGSSPAVEATTPSWKLGRDELLDRHVLDALPPLPGWGREVPDLLQSRALVSQTLDPARRHLTVTDGQVTEGAEWVSSLKLCQIGRVLAGVVHLMADKTDPGI